MAIQCLLGFVVLCGLLGLFTTLSTDVRTGRLALSPRDTVECLAFAASVQAVALLVALWLLLAGCAHVVGANAHFQLCDGCTLVDHSCGADYKAVLIVPAAMAGFSAMTWLGSAWAREEESMPAGQQSAAQEVDRPVSQRGIGGETAM